MKVELIVCFKDMTWKNEIFFQIPDETPKLDEAVIEWLAENNKDFQRRFVNRDDVVFIGVYNWDVT